MLSGTLSTNDGEASKRSATVSKAPVSDTGSGLNQISPRSNHTGRPSQPGDGNHFYDLGYQLVAHGRRGRRHDGDRHNDTVHILEGRSGQLVDGDFLSIRLQAVGDSGRVRLYTHRRSPDLTVPEAR